MKLSSHIRHDGDQTTIPDETQPWQNKGGIPTDSNRAAHIPESTVRRAKRLRVQLLRLGADGGLGRALFDDLLGLLEEVLRP
jgi:hypothetical protein